MREKANIVINSMFFQHLFDEMAIDSKRNNEEEQQIREFTYQRIRKLANIR